MTTKTMAMQLCCPRGELSDQMIDGGGCQFNGIGFWDGVGLV
jgi:hypothetical protein